MSENKTSQNSDSGLTPVLSQEEEILHAKSEGRIPICVTCKHPLIFVERTRPDLVWGWDEDNNDFFEGDLKEMEGFPRHFCDQCADRCKAEFEELDEMFE